MSVGRAGAAANWPRLGFGAGLRADHYEDVLAGAKGVDHVTIEGAGHFLQETRGPHVAQEMIAFMRAHPAG